MSIKALNWAFDLKTQKSSHKLVLIAMANTANDDGFCFPSAKHIQEKTCLNIKTVESTMVALKKLGVITDTGRRIGATNQVIIYKLSLHISELKLDVPVDNSNTPKNGGVIDVPEEDVVLYSNIKTPPKTGELGENPYNTPVFGDKHPQKRGTEPSLNISLSKNEKEKPKTEPDICEQLRLLGINGVPSGDDPCLLKVMDEGVTYPQLVEAAKYALKNDRNSFGYVLARAERRLEDSKKQKPGLAKKEKSQKPTHPSHLPMPERENPQKRLDPRRLDDMKKMLSQAPS